MIFEIQLSTTFLSVIEERQSFYKNENVFVLWVLKSFQSDDDLRKFTENDVIYSNKQNAFILDNESLTKCELEKDLVFKCYFKKYSIDKNEVIGEWHCNFITLNDLIFDNESKKVFFFESDLDKKEKEELLSQAREYNFEKRNLKLRVDDTLYKLSKISAAQPLDFDKTLKYVKQLLENNEIFMESFQETEELYIKMSEKVNTYNKIKNLDFILYDNKKMSVILNKAPKQEKFILDNKESIFYQTQEGNSFTKSKKYRLANIEREIDLKRIMSSPYVRFLYCFDNQIKSLEEGIILIKENLILNFNSYIDKLNRKILLIDLNCSKLDISFDNELEDYICL